MAVILLASSLGLVFMGGSDVSSADPQKITYEANNGTGASYEVEYSGIASSEYNPEYWQGTVEGTDVVNWKGEVFDFHVSSRITLTVTNIIISYYNDVRITLDNNLSYSVVSSELTYYYYGQRTVNADVYLSLDSSGNEQLVIEPWQNINSQYKGTATVVLDVAGDLQFKKAFGGWTDGSSDYLPGDVVSTDVSSLQAKWITPDIFLNLRPTVSVSNNDGAVTTLVSAGLPMKIYNNRLSPYTAYLYPEYSVTYGDGRTGPSMYGTLYWLSSGTAYNLDGVTLSSGTYRSADFNNPATLNTQNGRCTLGGAAVIDNVVLRASSAGKDHGDGGNGIEANGNILIMGTGLTAVGSTSPVGYGDNPIGPQIIGGSASRNIDSRIMSKEIVFGATDVSGNEKELTVDIATCVIIHSGIYFSVIAGSVGRDIGSSGNPNLSTYLVMNGGTVLDTVIGGNGYSGTIFAVGQNNSDTDQELQGGTFVYMLGADLPGDDYEDRQSGYYGYRADRGDYILNESSILEGGSSNSKIWGSTHVFLSGDTTVFDVQAGGRRGSTEVNFTYLEITGDAVVRHIACGTITDGNSGNTSNAHGVRIAVDGNAKVATLCGGGYDTWDSPNSPSMISGTVDVEMYGGTVGYVYGGGFRGSLGTPTSSVTVNVHIIGGTVLHDVYGGGRGGIEKILHNSGGANGGSGSGFKDSTGKSYIYGDVNVVVGNVSDAFGDRTAVVMGNVYGGGESVPYLKSYTGYSNGFFSTQNPDVAAVFGTTSVSILDGADVRGNVYGSGRGIFYDESGNISAADKTEYSTMYLYTYSGSAFSPANVAWMSGGVATYYTSSEKDLSTFAKVDGPSSYTDPVSSVTVSGGSVTQNVYGGGAYGITTQAVEGGNVVCAVTITGGTIGKSVYGGGVGVAGKTSVYGGTAVKMTGGTVAKDVYGGARYGVVDYGTEVVIIGGMVNGTVYGGGYGVNGHIATKGVRKVYLKDAVINGSVYGGSSLGDDGTESAMGSHSYVVVSSGVSLEEDVFGGGFQGNTYGKTNVDIGFEWADISGSVDTTPIGDAGSAPISIGGSVYAGGNVGELSEDMTPYSSYLVWGGGSIRIYGEGLSISLRGSVMGSGNSCLTAGETSIQIFRFVNLEEMQGIHRFDYVMVNSSSLDLRGRGTVDNSGKDGEFSIFGIGRMVLQNGSVLKIYSAVDDMDQYESLNKDGNPTTVSSPLNSIIFGSGNTFVIRDTESEITYGRVIGYTAISVNNDTNYGGYALGSLASPGGFVLMQGGSYVEADRTDYVHCRCWFIAGSKSVSTSTTIFFSGSDATYAGYGSAEVEMVKLLENTGVRYTGGAYIESNPDKYSFVGSGQSGSIDSFEFLIGSDEGSAASKMLFGGGSGVDFLPGDSQTYNATGNGDDGHLNRFSSLHLKFIGTIENKTQYVGYIMLYFQEVSEIEYATSSGVETSYVITNNTEVRVDLYTRSSNTGNIGGDFTLNIGTISGSGSTNLQIPPYPLISGATVEVTGMEALNGGGNAMGVVAIRNLDNRDGWTSKSPETSFSPGYSGKSTVGILQGVYVANLKFSVEGFNNTTTMSYLFTVTITEKDDGAVHTFNVTVNIREMPQVNVTFVDEQQDYSVTYAFDYGTVLKSSDCPPTRANFIGWYTDNGFNNAYNFKTPLTKNINLYARYNLTVTFDNGDGTSSLMYVADQAGGTLINPPREPTRSGYVFEGWYKDRDHVVAWNFASNRVTTNMVLYANWVGVEIDVSFVYSDGGVDKKVQVNETDYTFIVNYGSRFGVLDEEFSLSQNADVTYLERAKDVVSGLITEEFIRWSVTVNGSSVAVYDDTVANFYQTENGRNYVVLYAVTSPVALQIKMDVNTQALTAEVAPPSTFLVYPASNSVQGDEYGSYYEFAYGLNGATRTG